MRSTTASRSLVACSTRPSRRTRLSRAPASSASACAAPCRPRPAASRRSASAVGRLLALLLGLGDLLAQRHPLGLDLGRLGGELGDGRRDLLAPRVELDDLAVGIAEALAPAGMVLRDLAQPLDPHRGLARQTIAVALGLDQRRAQLGDARAQRAGGHAVGLGVGDRRQARLAEGAAHLGIGDVAHDLGHRLLDAGEARAQLVGAARHLGVPVARLRWPRARPAAMASCAARSAARVASPASWVLRRAASATCALVRARLLDAGLLGIARGGEPALLGVDACLRLGLLGRRRRRSAGGSRPAGCAG